jgi:hypothetical protein
MKSTKQRLLAISAIAFFQIVNAAETKGSNCPEIPPGTVVLGKYCPPAQVVVADPVNLSTTPVVLNEVRSALDSTQKTAVLGVATPPPADVVTVSFPPPLVIRQGDRLMPTLKTWLASQSIELVWAASATTSGRVRDVVLEDDFQASAADVQTALNEVLEPFGFEAEIAKNSGAVKRVTVRNSRNGL